MTPAWVAGSAGGRLVAGGPDGPGPRRAVVDSRLVAPGDLFVGLLGEHVDGGAFARAALAAGAWGVLVGPAAAAELVTTTAAAAPAPVGTAPATTGAPPATAGSPPPAHPPVVIVADDPLAALADLARAWRRELACPVVGVTGSTGKTSTKDILRALLGQTLRTHANRENFNTEVGLPLSLLEAERGSEVLVLEMAMRGPGQIAELARIAEPDVGVVVNVGPVHLELLGTVERVAAAKAELIDALAPGGGCVVPVGERLLAEHLRGDLRTLTFGAGGDVSLVAFEEEGARACVDVQGEAHEIELSFSEPHNVRNALAALAAAHLLGVTPPRRLEVAFSSLRGEVVQLEPGITVVNDCYNANPMSMAAALEHLAGASADRRIALLGTMAELGPGSDRFHEEIGRRAEELGVDVLVTVGEAALPYGRGFAGETYAVGSPEEAGALLGELAQPGDRVLVKGSRSAGLERVLAPEPSLS